MSIGLFAPRYKLTCVAKYAHGPATLWQGPSAHPFIADNDCKMTIFWTTFCTLKRPVTCGKGAKLGSSSCQHKTILHCVNSIS